MNRPVALASNPYVYPSDQFLTVGKPVTAVMKESRIVSEASIASLIEKILPPLDIHLAQDPKDSAKNVLAIFLSPNVCFGGAQNIQADEDHWLKRIRFFTDQHTSLSFTIHGFPFKMPISVKTNRRLPDLGDYASLFALNRLMITIGNIYPPGAQLTVICEDGFAPFMGIAPHVASDYQASLTRFAYDLGLSNLQFTAITDMEKLPGYQKIFNSKVRIIEEKYKQDDEDFAGRYRRVFPILFRVVDSTAYEDREDDLVLAYNASTSQISLATLKSDKPELAVMIDDISGRTHDAIVAYFAYLETRDDLGFVERIAPNSLPLSVSPKKGRLGVFPIEPSLTKLPYHAVPVIKEGHLAMYYLYDLLRESVALTPVHLESDDDPLPFYYEMNG